MPSQTTKDRKALQQVIVIHRNYCPLDQEGHRIKFSGPSLTDPGLEKVAKAVRAALKKEGYRIAK
jgi:hypothetical protein